MNTDEFNAFHMPALEMNEARHTLLLGVMPHPSSDPAFEARRWTLGGPGACALLTALDRPIILGDLDESQCHALASEVYSTVFAGVIGPDSTAHWFVARARQLGLEFKDPIPQRVHELTAPPIFPGAAGTARLLTPDDLDLYVEWTLAFVAEAVPDDPRPAREHLAKRLGKGLTLFWEVDGKPVSMAGNSRRTRHGASIAPVYTPPECRGRGYAGSVTAALAEHLFAAGNTMVCLYTDLRNPFANRCYAKIGFKPVCASWHYPRRAENAQTP